MIDSIVFRIHDLDRHSRVVDLFKPYLVSGTRQKAIQTAELDFDDFKKQVFVKKMLIDHVKGDEIPLVDTVHLPSHHGHLVVRVNSNAGFIEFNFSIPKYLYGTNVFQFVPHWQDREYYEYFSCEDFESLGDSVYRRLRSFLRFFLETKIGKDLVDEYFVQVTQLDLVYNKFFNTPEDAKVYLRDLKRIRKPHETDTAQGKGIFHSGIHFHTSDWAQKIYHKGPEFRKHDRRRLVKKWPKELLNKVQAIADRILRYEVSFRTGRMNELFKDFIFRKDDEQWRKCWKYSKSASSNDFIIDSKGVKHLRHEMSRYQKQLVDYGDFIRNKNFHFNLWADTAFHKVYEYQDDEIRGRKEPVFERGMMFNKALFRELWKAYRKFFDHFAVSYQGDLVDLMQVCAKGAKNDAEKMARLISHASFKGEIPSDVTEHVSWRSLNNLVLFLRDHTWDDARTSGVLSERQYFRYRRLFKCLGIQNVASEIVNGSGNGFRDYYDAIGPLQSAFNLKHFLQPVSF